MSSTAQPNPLEVFRTDLIPGLLFLAAILLYAPRLSTPPKYMFDEVYHAYTAGQWAAGNTDAYHWRTKATRSGVAYMWNHPPVGVLAISGGILLWGDTPFGWRFSSAIFGAAGVLLIYVLGLRLTGSRLNAILAAVFVLFDPLWFVQSRIGMLDIFGTFFAAAALLSLFGFLTGPRDRVAWPLVRTGLLLGLALATKWNAAYVSTLSGLIVLHRGYSAWRDVRRDPSPATRACFRSHLTWIPVAFGAVPALVYLVAYVPFFATGHDWSQFVELQNQIFRYHTGLETLHSYQSLWWQWPLLLRPVWYWVSYSGETVANIYANGNLFLYWAFIPSAIWVCHRWWRESNPALPILLVGFFGQWLPWALSPRSAFLYHFLPAVPFGALSVAVVATRVWRRGGAWRWAVGLYVTLLIAYFAYFYPVHAGVSLTRDAFEQRIWFPSWR